MAVLGLVRLTGPSQETQNQTKRTNNQHLALPFGLRFRGKRADLAPDGIQGVSAELKGV